MALIGTSTIFYIAKKCQNATHSTSVFDTIYKVVGAITTGCMSPFVPRTKKNEVTTTIYMATCTIECYGMAGGSLGGIPRRGA